MELVLKRLAARKDADSAPFDPQFRKFEQFGQGPKCARGDGVHRGNERRRESFDPAAVNSAGAAVERATCRKNAHLRRSLSTQCTTAPGVFEMKDSNHHSRESRSTAEIEPTNRIGNKVKQLCGIHDVPHPDHRQGGVRDQVCYATPAGQKIDIDVEALL